MDNGAENYRRFLRGDEEGIAEIVRAYKDGLIFYLNGYVNDISLAEDLAEDTFFRLLVKKPKFSGKSAFKTFLYAIGKNIARDALAKRCANAFCFFEREGAGCMADEKTPERYFIEKESKSMVAGALAKLPPMYQNVLWLIYFDGCSNKEAAAILQKNDRQIKNLLYRAKRAMKQKLEREDFRYEEQ